MRIFGTALLAAMLTVSGQASAIDNYLATGVQIYDGYDMAIISQAEDLGHPDARLLKSQAWWESDQTFDAFSTSQDTPCGDPEGWGYMYTHSYGLFQVTPACGEGVPHMLRFSGKPNLVTSPTSALFSSSVYNPVLNIYVAVKSITEGFEHFKALWPTCPVPVLAKHAAAGWVGNWEEMTSCGDFGNSNMQDYLTNVIGFYETYYGPYPTN